jgi:hypothetical protein
MDDLQAARMLVEAWGKVAPPLIREWEAKETAFLSMPMRPAEKQGEHAE